MKVSKYLYLFKVIYTMNLHNCLNVHSSSMVLSYQAYNSNSNIMYMKLK